VTVPGGHTAGKTRIAMLRRGTLAEHSADCLRGAVHVLLERLRKQVLEANLELVRRGLVLYTFGNVSGIDRDKGLVAIKPSGVDYKKMTPADIVVTNLDGAVVEGKLRPSSDLPTHLVLYAAFPAIGGVAHTHSEYATAWAQACRPIPCLGTTHADSFHATIPVTTPMLESEIESAYEANTGHAIVRAFANVDPAAVPAVLVANHGPFAWGKDAASAAYNAVILENVARTAYMTMQISPQAQPISLALHDKHFLRKHGAGAYYGQSSKKR
jgi:L-ribulose-5-phosphate 4-epimerase